MINYYKKYKKSNKKNTSNKAFYSIDGISAISLRKKIKQLEFRINQLHEEYDKNKKEIAKYYEQQKLYNLEYNEKIQPLLDKLQSIKNDPDNYEKYFGKFISKQLNVTSKYRIEKLEFQIELHKSAIKDKFGLMVEPPRKFDIQIISTLKSNLDNYKEDLQKIIDKENKKDIEKGLAASARNESRKRGDEIKIKLVKTEYCPYCFSKIEGRWHADHIYPIFKGGLSIESNMVYVCAECNIKKGTMTLRAFIEKYKLNRELIENSLKQLEKDF